MFGSRELADKIEDPTGLVTVTEEEDNYSSNHFLMDLTDAFDLPNYFTDEAMINELEKMGLLNVDRDRPGMT